MQFLSRAQDLHLNFNYSKYDFCYELQDEVEEKKKYGEDGNPLVPGQKRAPSQPGEENSVAKKGKPDVDCGSGNALAVAPTESPGSSDEMVIDESSESTENVSKY